MQFLFPKLGFAAIAVGLAIVVSCSVEPLKEEAPETTGPIRTVITASAPAQVTKTGLGGKIGNQYPLLWQPGDVINVNGQASLPLANDFVPASSASFVFEGALNSPYYAAYPSSSVSGYGAGTATITIPQNQTYVAGSFDPAAAIMLASGDSEGLTFSMKMSFIHLTVNEGTHTGHRISRVVVSSNGTEKMSGAFTTDYSSLAPTGAANSSITVDIPGGLALGGDMFIAYPAQTYASGLSIEIVDESGHFMRKTSAAAHNPEAGHIYPTSLTFEPTGTYVGAELPAGDLANQLVHTWKDMESASPVTDSHASAYQRSCLTMIGETSNLPDTLLYQYASGHTGVCYPRFIKAGENKWLMFYHYGNEQTWAGNYSYFLTSPNLTDWSFGKKLFALKNSQHSPYYDSAELPETYRRAYAGTDLCRLPDGRILAVAATRAFSKYQLRPLDNGLAIRYSSDNGVTWTDDQLVMVGTCWEPYPIVLASGRIQIYYTDAQPYYPEGNSIWAGGTAVTGSGSSYIYSDDNGSSWHYEDAYGEHLHAFRQIRKTAANGTKLYTDQMPVVVRLNDGSGLVGAMECLVDPNNYYTISLAYTGADGDWGAVDANGCLPADRTNNFVQGAAPYITQFPTGETVLVYNRNNVFYYQIGDASGRNFQGERRLLEDTGFWGTLKVTGPNTVLAGLGGNKTLRSIRVARFWLNHDIKAPRQAITLDGNGDEWTGKEALYAGSTGEDQVILRAATSDYSNLKLLVEAVTGNASVHVDLGVSGVLKRISLNSSGLVSSEIDGVEVRTLACMASDMRSGYVWEVSVPFVSNPGTAVPAKLTIEGDTFTDTFQPSSGAISALPRIIIQ